MYFCKSYTHDTYSTLYTVSRKTHQRYLICAYNFAKYWIVMHICLNASCWKLRNC